MPALVYGQNAALAGTWTLQIDRSMMGGEHPFPNYRLTKTIVLSNDAVEITDSSENGNFINTAMPPMHTQVRLTLDGAPHIVEGGAGPRGRRPEKRAVTAGWEGTTLLLTTVTNGFANYGTERLYLANDGTLIDVIEGHSTRNDSSQRLIFTRAASSK